MTVEDITTASETWTVRDSEQLYHIVDWGGPYFKINEAGRVEVDPSGEGRYKLDMFELVSDVQRRGLNLPLLIRFSDILADRIRRLNEAFRGAIAQYEYGSEYRGVMVIYPLGGAVYTDVDLWLMVVFALTRTISQVLRYSWMPEMTS